MSSCLYWIHQESNWKSILVKKRNTCKTQKKVWYVVTPHRVNCLKLAWLKNWVSSNANFRISVPWVPEFFLACDENFRCWPKAEAARKTFRAGHYKDLTETGNRARKPDTALEKSLAPRVGYPGISKFLKTTSFYFLQAVESDRTRKICCTYRIRKLLRQTRLQR